MPPSGAARKKLLGDGKRKRSVAEVLKGAPSTLETEEQRRKRLERERQTSGFVRG